MASRRAFFRAKQDLAACGSAGNWQRHSRSSPELNRYVAPNQSTGSASSDTASNRRADEPSRRSSAGRVRRNPPSAAPRRVDCVALNVSGRCRSTRPELTATARPDPPCSSFAIVTRSAREAGSGSVGQQLPPGVGGTESDKVVVPELMAVDQRARHPGRVCGQQAHLETRFRDPQ